MESTADTLRKMRKIVAAGDPGACGQGCLEDAMSQVLFGRSWWLDPEEGELEDVFASRGIANQRALAQEPLYHQLITKGRELFPLLHQHPQLWSISDRITKPQRLDVIDALLAEL